ncbi:hypothetical protein LY90DRAFT_664894 [Neocallimastix californiae]|jgi:hypothetical protein|uniref:Uncharacterized protein n=1 Tax=Neocallimastix californiae TaxID=1754190 RepID=A0A1Y2F709_9FUNG|nr:hypothetical protein LY90DRAFT_664894 [Neocallimastix californiae]|eukprot:ORY78715.1 hypothetical protein LY90DRAFT_664894 [Neocallimastix californiae]
MIFFLFICIALTNLCFSYHVYEELFKRKDDSYTINYSVKDAFIEVCDNGKCEKIFEDEINGGHECTVAIYNECPITSKYDRHALHLLCDVYDYEKCNKLYTEGYNSIPACQNKNPKYLEAQYKINKKVNSHYQLVCAKDYKGELCPYTNFVLDKMEKKTINETIFWNYVTASCTSKVCCDVFPNASNNENEIIDKEYDKLFDKALKYLKSENCTSQQKAAIRYFKSNSHTNNALLNIQNNIIKNMSLLLIILSSFYLLF